MKKRTLDVLRNKLEGRIYIFCKDKKTLRIFLENAEREGFLFGKVKPTESEGADIIALEHRKQLSYVNFVGHIEFQCGGSDNKLYRVDYSKYVNGERDFIFHGETYKIMKTNGKFHNSVIVVGNSREDAIECLNSHMENCNSIEEEENFFEDVENKFNVLIVLEDDDLCG